MAETHYKVEFSGGTFVLLLLLVIMQFSMCIDSEANRRRNAEIDLQSKLAQERSK